MCGPTDIWYCDPLKYTHLKIFLFQICVQMPLQGMKYYLRIILHIKYAKNNRKKIEKLFLWSNMCARPPTRIFSHCFIFCCTEMCFENILNVPRFLFSIVPYAHETFCCTRASQWQATGMRKEQPKQILYTHTHIVRRVPAKIHKNANK